MRIDTHFHPNFFWLFPKGGVYKKAKRIREKFTEQNIDAVIVTEHVYKNPAKSYKTLLDHKPLNAKTILIPGVEALTKEGIDIIVFSGDTYVYTCKELMQSKNFTFDQMITYIHNDNRLYGVVTHPLLPSRTAMISHYKKKNIIQASKTLGIIEKHNAAFLPVRKYLQKSRVRSLWFVKKFIKKIITVEHVPSSYYEKNTLIFGGSDAHSPEDIGDCLYIESTHKKVRKALFDIKAKRTYSINSVRGNPWRYTFRNCLIIAQERILKFFNTRGTDRTYFKK